MATYNVGDPRDPRGSQLRVSSIHMDLKKGHASTSHALILFTDIYAAFFALNFAHRARWAAAVRLRAPRC